MDKKFRPTLKYYLQYIFLGVFSICGISIGFFLAHGNKDEFILGIMNSAFVVLILLMLYTVLAVYVKVTDSSLIFKKAWRKEQSIPLSDIDHVVYGFNFSAGYSGAYEFLVIKKDNSRINIPTTFREDEIIALILQKVNIKIIKYEPLSKQLTNWKTFFKKSE